MSDLILHNPLDDPLPSDPVERIHRLARDLAWGAINNLWSARIEIRSDKIVSPRSSKGTLLQNHLDHWGDKLPSANLMIAFGYLEEQSGKSPSGAKITLGLLTLEAFARLKQPTRTPKIYISYHRAESSALALLVAARLQRVGIQHPVIDMNRNPGDVLHAEFEQRVRESDYLVCLIAPTTMESNYVIAELEWALDAPSVNIVPIWHNGFVAPHDYPQELAARNAIRVSEESAEAYNTAIIRLLNRLGYAP